MSPRFSLLFLLVLLSGCGRDDPPLKVADNNPAPKEEPAPQKIEPKKIEPSKQPPKKEQVRTKLVPLDLRDYGLFAVIDAPEGTLIGSGSGNVILSDDSGGIEIGEGAIDLARTKQDWTSRADFVLKALVIDEANALLAEVERAGKKDCLFRVNVSIDGKPYHLKNLELGTISLEQARQTVDRARSLRQTPELKKAKVRQETALGALKEIGAMFPAPATTIIPRQEAGTIIRNPTSVTLPYLPALDEKIVELLQAIPTLEAISILHAEKISPPAISSLSTLAKLRRLNIVGGGLNGPVVAAIGNNLNALHQLTLSGAPLTNQSIKPLGNLKSLTILDLSQTRITDNGIIALRSLPNLQILTLDGTDVTGASLSQLQECKRLSQLSLADTAITDANVKALLVLTGLTELNLSETDVTVAGLELLAELPKLTMVHLLGTNITVADLDKLRDAHPETRIFKSGKFFELDRHAEPVPEAVAPVVPFATLPPADPVAMVAKYEGTIKRDEAADGKPIIDIDLHGSLVTDDAIGHLRDASKLQSLNLEGCTFITDAALPYLASLTSLEEIDLRGTGVRGDGLAHLKGMVKLRKLLLTPTMPLTSPQLAFVARLPNLEVLNFTVTEPAYPKLKILGRISNLRELNLEGVTLSNHKLSGLTAWKNLETLILGDKGALSDRGLLSLQGLARLKKLVIANYDGSDAGLEPLRMLSNLEALELYGPYISDRGIAFIAALSKLERVRLDRLKITDGGLTALRGLGKLIGVSVVKTGITDRGLATIAELKELEFLDLSYTRVTDAGLAALKDNEELRSLLLNGTNISGSGFMILDGLPRLHRLQLTGSKVTDAGLTAIGQIAPLRILDLGWTAITATGLDSLRSLRQLEDLSLDSCKRLSDDAAAVLKSFRSLKRVNLRGCKFSTTAIQDLRQTIKRVEFAENP